MNKRDMAALAALERDAPELVRASILDLRFLLSIKLAQEYTGHAMVRTMLVACAVKFDQAQHASPLSVERFVQDVAEAQQFMESELFDPYFERFSSYL